MDFFCCRHITDEPDEPPMIDRSAIIAPNVVRLGNQAAVYGMPPEPINGYGHSPSQGPNNFNGFVPGMPQPPFQTYN